VGRCAGRWEVRCCVVESRDARFLVLKWVQRWHGPSSSLYQLWVPVASARSRAQARCRPPPTSTPKIGHHDFPLYNNEPPTSLRTDPPAHPAYGLCSDSFEHLERWLFDSFGLHRAAQGVRLCVQLIDQLNARDRAGRDRAGCDR